MRSLRENWRRFMGGYWINFDEDLIQRMFSMDLDKMNEMNKKACHQMDAGNFEGALELAYEIKNMGPHYRVSYAVSGLLIDIGLALGKKNITKEGVELLEKDFDKIVNNLDASSAHYNLANGYSALFSFKFRKNKSFHFF